jgi:hypothetical protein
VYHHSAQKKNNTDAYCLFISNGNNVKTGHKNNDNACVQHTGTVHNRVSVPLSNQYKSLLQEHDLKIVSF